MQLYKINEASSHQFCKVPKDLFRNPHYRQELSSDAKLLYALLLDRMELSRQNKWVNSKGEIYILFPKDDAAAALGVGERTVYRAFRALEKCRLIKQVRQGFNKPNKIFVAKIDYSYSGKDSGPVKLADQEMSNWQGNETDNSETERLYIALPSNVLFVQIYMEQFERHFNRKHMRVTPEQRDYILAAIELLQENGIDDGEWADAVMEYFDNLPKSNNGNILAFLRAAGRYFQVDTTRL